ncbi:M56 family metallopeptidase [Riemerella columbina]|uniref:M56 family metallopeptidase n=1 Tax=Riemerella columbina TaxID=103810 RepID=UPI000380F5AA|nr:M56 family metallopeptidase [Riemerella columbina]
MEALFYIVKVIVGSGLMYGYYLVFLKDKTFHHYNRFYLLATVVISLLLPLIKVKYFTIKVHPKLYTLLSYNTQTASASSEHGGVDYLAILFSVMALIALYHLAKMGIGIFKVYQLKQQYPKQDLEGVQFYQTDLSTAPFSYFKNLFWKESIALNSDVGRQILKHEMVHITQRHSLDKFLLSLVQAVFWFNPIFYFLKKELYLIHEYLADKQSVQNTDTRLFAEMLLTSHFSTNPSVLANPLFSSDIKKRLMMLKKSHTKFAYLRKVAALPMVFILTFAYAVNTQNNEIKELNAIVDEAVSAEDTIRLNSIQDISDAIEQQHDIIDQHRSTINQEYKKISKLRQKIEDKRAELLTIENTKGRDSNAFIEKGNELAKLYQKVDAIYNSPQYTTATKEIETAYELINAYYQRKDEVRNAMRKVEQEKREKELAQREKQRAKELFQRQQELKNRPLELKQRVKELNENFSEVEMAEIEKIAAEAEKIAEESIKAAAKAEKVAIKATNASKEAERAAKEAEVILNSKKVKKGLKLIEISSDQLKANPKYMDITLLNAKDGGKVQLYVNGKKVEDLEAFALDKNTLKKINIKQSKKNKEVWIFTK